MSHKVAFLTTIFPMKVKCLYDFFDSLLKQTYNDFDVLVVNDGYENFNDIKMKYSKLNIIELKYLNTPAKNREYGINYVINNSYDILIFGDSDDYFSSNRIEHSINLLSKFDIVVNDLSLFDGDGIYCKKYLSNRIENNTKINYEFIKDKNIFGMTNSSLNINILDKVNFEDNLIAVDWYLFKNLLKNKCSAIFTNETESFYRQHNDNTIGLKMDNNYLFWWEKI